MIDIALTGKIFQPYSAAVEKGQLRFFAKAVGETNPAYVDDIEAKTAGYRSLPIPPTFLLIDPASVNLKPPFGLSLSKPCAPFDKLRANVQVSSGRLNSLEIEQPTPWVGSTRSGLNIARGIPYGEQSRPSLCRRRADLRALDQRHLRQKNGTLEFVVRETLVTNQDAGGGRSSRCRPSCSHYSAEYLKEKVDEP